MPSVDRLLIVDADPVTQAALTEQFAFESDFQVNSVRSVREMLEYVQTDRVDLILLHIGDTEDGETASVRELRSEGFSAPIILLITKEKEDVAEKAVEEGADDYVFMPFRFTTLLSRIRTQLQHFEISEDTTFSIGSYLFKPGLKQMIGADGKKLKLTEKETAILRFLHRADQAIVGRDILLAEVWGYSALVSTHTLETHIYRLRKKIEKDPAHATLLVTEPGGYKLVV